MSVRVAVVVIAGVDDEAGETLIFISVPSARVAFMVILALRGIFSRTFRRPVTRDQ